MERCAMLRRLFVWSVVAAALSLELLAGSFKLIYKDKPDMNDVMK
jgi:hypothetical protein